VNTGKPDHPAGIGWRRANSIRRRGSELPPAWHAIAIALYWLYLRSVNSPTLDSQDPQSDAVAEIAMHRFFQSLSTPITPTRRRSRKTWRRPLPTSQAAEPAARLPGADSAAGL